MPWREARQGIPNGASCTSVISVESDIGSIRRPKARQQQPQKRWRELRPEAYDQGFSLRLSAKERLYGIVTDGVFQMIRFEPIHEIYDVRK